MKKTKIGIIALTTMLTFSGLAGTHTNTSFAMDLRGEEELEVELEVNIDLGQLKKTLAKKIDEVSEGDASEGKLYSLERLKTEIQESELTRVDQDELIKIVNKKIEEIQGIINREKLPFSEDELKGKVKVESSGSNYYVTLPTLKGRQEYTYELYEEEEKIKSGTANDRIDLPEITKEITFKLELLITEGRGDELLKTTITLEIKDQLVPDLDNAYIEDGIVSMKFKDDYVLNGEYYYIKNGKKIKTKIKDNKFKVDIPSEIELVLMSPLGKEKRIELNIKIDNSLIHGSIAPELETELRDKRLVKLNHYKSIKNLYVGYNGDIINLKEESEHLIKEKYGAVNTEDITYSSDDMDIDDVFGDMNKPGLSTVKINHSFYTNEELTFYVYVKEDKRIFNTNIDKIEIKGKMTTDNEKFKARDFIDAKEKIEGYDPILDFIFVIDDNMAFTVDKEIDIKKKEMNSYKVIDVLRDEEHEINLTYKEEKEEVLRISFKDVKGSHWAYHDIKDLSFAGIISGYTDGTYKPDNNISIKEFMTLLNKSLNKGDLDIKNFKNSAKITLPETDWAYLDAFSIHRKIAEEDLNKMSFSDFNRSITRGEVAFLVDISVKLEEADNIVELIDIKDSLYEESIQALVSGKIINGYNDKSYKPEGKITRAEASTTLNKLLKTSKGEIDNE